MAATYRAYRTAVTNPAANTVILGVNNAVGSGKTVKVVRIWCANATNTATITGVLQIAELWRITSPGAPTGVTTIVPYDSTNAALPAQVTVFNGGTPTLDVAQTEPFIRWTTTSEEFGASNAAWPGFAAVMGSLPVWDAGYGDATVVPIALPEGYGLIIRAATGTGTVGVADWYLEFTLE
jgi:hypothetical protein